MTSCYTGPVGTQGVGACTPGVAACNDQGTALGSCVGDVLPALENCAATADEDCDGSSPVCTGSHNWSKRFGDANSQIGHRVAADASGNVFLAGYFTGTINLGGAPLTSAGGDDVFLAKFDAAGNHVWSKRFGNASAQIPFGLATDGSGNIVIIGQFEGSMDFGGGALTSAGALDVFLAKLDPMGNHVWSKRFGDASTQYGSDVAVDAAGNVFITGGLAGTVSFGGPPISATNLQNLFLAKLDSAGNHLWSKALGGPAELPDGTLAADPYGNVILTAWIIGALDLGGGPLPVGGSWDVLAAKFDATGNHVWSKQFGGTNDQGARAVAVDATGNVFLAGDFLNAIDFGGGVLNNPSGYDVYVAKLDPAGNHLWSKQFGGSPTNANGYGMTVDVAGNVILTGGFSGTVSFGGSPLTGAGGTDVFVAKLDAAGDHVWSYRFGDAVDQRAYDATTDGSGNILLAGIMQGTVNFGGSALTSAGGYDAFLVKLAP
ncbi:MAG: hypothetical protein HOV80_01395 [Polyangiaceae bacterium]|nr:hypothetical protein [Polyangiaceae bacterium]